MLYAIIGGIGGLALGFALRNNISFSSVYSVYIYLLILALTNTLITIICKKNMGELKIIYCFIYVFVDIILAIILAFLGEKLGLPLYLIGVFAYGNNIYRNIYSRINTIVKKKKV